MKRLVTIMAAASAVALAPVASAADFTPGDVEFQVDDPGNDFLGVINADLGNNGLVPGATPMAPVIETDTYTFTIDEDGYGSGSLTTNYNVDQSLNLDFISATFDNGTSIIPLSIVKTGNVEQIFGNFLPIFGGQQNVLSITYRARGAGSYGGQITFEPGAVPEPATWGLMVLGFAALGFAMRRRKSEVRVRYAL